VHTRPAVQAESNGDGFSVQISPTTSWHSGRTGEETKLPSKMAPANSERKNPFGPRGLSGTRTKSPAAMRRPFLTPLVGIPPAVKQDLEGVQSISSSTTRDHTEGASLESAVGQSGGNSLLGSDQLPAISSTQMLARRQADGQPATSVVGDASARPGQTNTVPAMHAAVKTESDGHWESHQWSSSLIRHHSKTPSADESSTRRDPTCSSVEGIMDERRHASNQGSDGFPALEVLLDFLPPKSPKPARQLGRLQAASIMASHEKARAHSSR